MTLSPAQSSALSDTAAQAGELTSWTFGVVDFGETAWCACRSPARYGERPRSQTRAAEEGSAGMPTAFCANGRNGDGPVIGLSPDHDAAPGNCQAATTRRRPRAGLGYPAGGHTDPHSGLGVEGPWARATARRSRSRFRPSVRPGRKMR